MGDAVQGGEEAGGARCRREHQSVGAGVVIGSDENRGNRW
jgi:hypothetical protein